MRNMLIAQSGGPTAAVNASLAGAVERAMESPSIGKVYGAKNGVEGVLRGTLVDLGPPLRTREARDRLRATPAMALGSCRRRLAETPDGEYLRIREILRRFHIGYFFYIGGNDSMDTVKKLSAWFRETGEDIRVVGIPKTIDNDLDGTDHTPGFGSAARYIATSLAETALDSAIYDIPTMTLVEVMGRNAGWLTAASALARSEHSAAPHVICMPEVPFDEGKFLRRVDELRRTEKHLIVAVSEGVRYADGTYVAAGPQADVFGHRQLSGAAHRVGALLCETFGCKVRAIEPNVLQRAAGHAASGTDLLEAGLAGARAVELALSGETGVMASFRRVSNHPYEIVCESVDVGAAANVERTVPLDWIDADGFDIRPALLEYLRPLITTPGEEGTGVPEHFILPE